MDLKCGSTKDTVYVPKKTVCFLFFKGEISALKVAGDVRRKQ